MKFGYYQVTALIAIALMSCNSKKAEEATSDPLIAYSVAKVFPHDPKAFTQGMTIEHGRLFESTGQNDSWIAEADIVTGKQDKKIHLEKKYFGEGICILNNKIYQLTWQSHIGFIYDVKTFEKKGEFTYPYEGWGITHDGKNLIISDGTDKLHFLDTTTLKEKSFVSVHNKFGALRNINELEYIDGYVYANQWQTTLIFKIDPSDGHVVGRLDLLPLVEKIQIAAPQADVLNGIAFEKKSKIMLVTGKLWPNLFALKLKDIPQ